MRRLSVNTRQGSAESRLPQPSLLRLVMNPYLSVAVGEIKNRARIYAHLYRELSREVGEDKATMILKKAIYARGEEKGKQLAESIKKPNLHELAVASVQGKGEMDAFGHEVVSEHPDYILLRLNRCPLVEAWKEAGIPPEGRKKMCDIAYQVDFGKFEAAGYRLTFDCRIADEQGSCDLRIEIREPAPIPAANSRPA